MKKLNELKREYDGLATGIKALKEQLDRQDNRYIIIVDGNNILSIEYLLDKDMLELYNCKNSSSCRVPIDIIPELVKVLQEII